MDITRHEHLITELLEGGLWDEITQRLREQLTNQEDDLMTKIGLSDEELYTAMKRIATMRLLLTEVGKTLGELAIEVSNSTYKKEK